MFVLALGSFLLLLHLSADIDLNTVLHPYYKLDYIKMTWGGAEKQAKERASGNSNAKNWQDEARKIIETHVSILICYLD